MNRRLSRQRGFGLVVAIIATMIFYVVAYLILIQSRTVIRNRGFAGEAQGLQQVQSALEQYAKANQAAFKAGKTVMFVNNQMAPTVSELQQLGFLTNYSPDVTAPWGKSFITTLTMVAGGGVTGAVILNGSILSAAGTPDRVHACNVAKAVGDSGVCTPPSSAAVLGNTVTTTTIPNPSGGAGAVGALVSIPP